MRAKEIREMTSEDLVVKCKELKEELFNLKFQLSLGQLTNTAKIREVRREIARFETIDTNSAEDFNNLLADVKQTWRGKNVSPNG